MSTRRWPRRGARSQTFGYTQPRERLELLQQHRRGLQEARRKDLGVPSRARWARRAPFARAGRRSASAHLEKMSRCSESFEFERIKGTTRRRQGADRRRRPDHAVELADQPDHLQGRAGARRRLHDGAEAQRNRAADAHHLRRNSRRGRRAARACSTSSTATGRRSARRSPPPRRRHGVVHRFDARRHPGRQGGGRHGQARPQELGGKSANILLPDADLRRP